MDSNFVYGLLMGWLIAQLLVFVTLAVVAGADTDED
jgi:hypothetical protein